MLVNHLDRKTTPFGPSEVEALEHLRPILAFGATCSRVDLDKRVGGIMLTRHLGSQLDLIEEG